MIKSEDLPGSLEVTGIEDAGLAYQKYNFQGLSSDAGSLPKQGISAGSSFVAIDTLGVKIFSEKLKDWYPKN